MTERVMIIDHGQLIADGTAETLKEQLGGDLVTITARSAEDAVRAAASAANIESAHNVTTDGPTLQCRAARGTEVLPAFLRSLDAQGLPAHAAEVRCPTLDDVFLALTGRSLREGAPTTEQQPAMMEEAAL